MTETAQEASHVTFPQMTWIKYKSSGISSDLDKSGWENKSVHFCKILSYLMGSNKKQFLKLLNSQ